MNRPIPLADPNPMMLYHVYSAVLMSIAGALYRGANGSPHAPALRGGANNARSLVAHISFMSDLLQDHSALIQAAGAADAPMYPIGDHTLWLEPGQMERYVGLRDGVLNAAPLIVRESAGLDGLQIAPAVAPMVEKELKVIQAAARGVLAMNTFGEAVEILRAGFAAAMYVFDLILHEDDHHAPQGGLR